MYQDRNKALRQLSLAVQINTRCDKLAKDVIMLSLSTSAMADQGVQLVPCEMAAIFIGGSKLTSDAASEVRFALGRVEARSFYTSPNTPTGKGLG